MNAPPAGKRASPRAASLLPAALAGAWRQEPPPWELSEADTAAVVPLLARTGLQGLVWYRLGRSALRTSPPGRALQQAARAHALQAALRAREIAGVFQAVRAQGVEPVLVKGWAITQLYPAPGLRPYGDIDLLIRPKDTDAARHALGVSRAVPAGVELHAQYNHPYDRTMEEVFARSVLVPLGEIAIRIPAPEDHLRLICLHLLGHGAWKPVWLCDVGAAVEHRPPDFDWERFLWGDRRYTEWVKCALGLARDLLGAAIDDTPVAEGAARLPRWLVPAVLRQWQAGTGSSFHEPLARPLSHLLRHPAPLLRQAKAHWRNPIEATVEMGAPFSEFPRLPLQVAAALRRAPGFIRGLAKAVGGRGRGTVPDA